MRCSWSTVSRRRVAATAAAIRTRDRAIDGSRSSTSTTDRSRIARIPSADRRSVSSVSNVVARRWRRWRPPTRRASAPWSARSGSWKVHVGRSRWGVARHGRPSRLRTGQRRRSLGPGPVAVEPSTVEPGGPVRGPARRSRSPENSDAPGEPADAGARCASRCRSRSSWLGCSNPLCGGWLRSARCSIRYAGRERQVKARWRAWALRTVPVGQARRVLAAPPRGRALPTLALVANEVW